VAVKFLPKANNNSLRECLFATDYTDLYGFLKRNCVFLCFRASVANKYSRREVNKKSLFINILANEFFGVNKG
jgi:hypothetical protein